ncbi:MAG: fumarylacetoacetate hydrolase family protein [Polyangiaceae bacterium]
MPDLGYTDVVTWAQTGLLDAAAFAKIERAEGPIVPFEEVAYEPLVAPSSKVICLGLNYVDHAAEANYKKPDYPVIFNRFPQSFTGHGRALVMPVVSTSIDYEAELCVVIGKRGRHVSKENALSHVLGYTLLNDGSIRDWQVRTHQWTLGKNFESSGAVGPELVTADELPPGGRGLLLTGRLNGTVMQQATTSDMIFDVETTIEYLSKAFTLEPGDLIAMGTPAGIGFARNPQVFMKPGDEFVVEVEKIGALRNKIVAEVLP